MLTKELDQETERLLADIVSQENTTTDELIRNLIRDRWLALQNQAKEAEAIAAMADASPTAGTLKQKSNKQTIANFMKKKKFC